MNTREHAASIGRTASIAGAVAVLLAPISALSRHATEQGAGDLESSVVRAWAEPAGDVLSPLLTWADADTVYLTWGKPWAIIFLATTLCAFEARRRRTAAGAERWAWRTALTGYVLLTAGAAGAYWTPLLDESFAVILAGMLLGTFGSSALGVGLIRRSFSPRVTAWLLAMSLPLVVLLSAVISLGAGALPMVLAWAVAGPRLAAHAPVRPTRAHERATFS